MKIIHLPQNVGNLPKELAEAERELGLKSQFLELSGHSNYNTPSSVRMKNFRGPIAGRISGLANILLKQHQLMRSFLITVVRLFTIRHGICRC